MHIAGVSLCLLFARLCPISLFPIIMLLIVRILSIYYENINTNASESLQTSYDHNKCVAIDKNGLRLLPNMLRICLFTNFRTKFLKFAKPRERPRMLTNTNECQAITMRPLSFVSKLPRYYVNEPIRNKFAQVLEQHDESLRILDDHAAIIVN